jgi:glycosyltransferase involved in cell wall biosynthesis
MCQAFARNGHNVTLIAIEQKNNNTENIYQYYGVDNIFLIKYVPWLKIKGRTFIYSFLAANTARKLNPDVIYCRDIIACFFSTCNRLPIILESHVPIIGYGKLVEFIFRKIIQNNKHFRKLIVITNALKNYYETNYPSLKNKIQVAPDGADPIPEHIEPIVLPDKGKRMQVGYIGHLYKGKGMEVISQLAPLCSWADFHIVGGTDADISYWKEVCKESSNIIFHGFVPHQQIYNFSASFDVVLLPNQEKVGTYGNNIANSIEDGDIGQWTSPMKAFEYMAAKKPIIASDLPVLREIFTDGETALLALPESVDIWKMNLKKLHDDDELAKKIADNAYNIFIEKYTWLARAKALI